MKNRTCIYSTVIIAFSLIFAAGCQKEGVSKVNQTNGRASAVFNPNLTYGTMTDQE